MSRLVAVRPILYNVHQYRAGDELPVPDGLTLAGWLEAGSAKREGDMTAKKRPKARPAVAQPGMAGLSSTGNQEDLAGRVPERPGKRGVRK